MEFIYDPQEFQWSLPDCSEYKEIPLSKVSFECKIIIEYSIDFLKPNDLTSKLFQDNLFGKQIV